MEIAVIGDGGHSRVVRELIRSNTGYTIRAILDDRYEQEEWSGGTVRGPLSMMSVLLIRYPSLKCVVAIGNNEVRKSMVTRLALPDNRYQSILHPSAIVSADATIGLGTVVMANTVIQANTIVGNHVIVNTGAIIEHDNRIEDYVHSAPRTTLTGAVHVQEGAMIGAGAVIIPGKSVGKWAVIGAGATVIHHIPDHCTAVGTPARVISVEKDVKLANGC